MIDYDPYSDAMLEDPFPTYRRLRDEAPAHYIEKYDCWALSRFADIVDASMDAEHYTMSGGSTSGHLMSGGLEVDTTIFMSMDPPDHTPRRALVSPLLGRRRIATFEPRIREIVDGILEPPLGQGKCDAVADVASPVSATIVCELVGLPPADGPLLRGWIHAFEPFFHHRPGGEGELAARNEAAGNLLGYLVRHVRERRRQPTGARDVMNAFLGARIDDRSMTDQEICVNLMSILIGGMDTVPKHFGSLVYWLARHPDQRARCAADPGLLSGAVEEALRFDSPTHILGRTARRDVALHGQTIRAGQGVLFLYASGNRDEREFDDPDRFDIDRRPPRQLAFGFGIHLCLGMHVARLESRIMMERLLAHSPEYAVDEDRVERCRTAGLHGYNSVPVLF